jgi:hypothetical protein
MNTKRPSVIRVLVLGPAVLLAASGLTPGQSPARDGQLTLNWYTVDGGGTMASIGGAFELSGTIGQPDTDENLNMTGGPFTLTGGLWPGVRAGVPWPGDCNDDGSVDIDDYAEIGNCQTGPGVVIDPACECADIDGDTDADLADFQIFQQEFMQP